MAKPTKVTRQETRDIPRNDWIQYLANFTRENRGAHAVLEVLGEGVGRQVATEDRPCDGISADVKDGEDTVWIAFSSAPDNHFTHGVYGVTAIRVRPAAADSGAAIEIDAQDGTITPLNLSHPEEYTLASGDPGENRPSV